VAFIVQALEEQLKNITDELSRARIQKQALQAAGKSKVGPSALAQHRAALRVLRPEREQVADEVGPSRALSDSQRAHGTSDQSFFSLALDDRMILPCPGHEAPVRAVVLVCVFPLAVRLHNDFMACSYQSDGAQVSSPVGRLV
jgi:hypothetical protein